MKISLKWLSEYVDVGDSIKKPQDLVQRLTSAGLEVESWTNLSGPFDQVVVAQILQKDKHPNADRLTLCQVTTGQGVVHQVVCGAKNHNAGDKVVLALPGAKLPGDFEIKRSTIRGVESAGMLCSDKELGLSTEGEGIRILPSSAPVGAGFAAFLGRDDTILEIKVTPNRADCLSHLGLAREIACLLNQELKIPAAPVERLFAQATGDLVKIDIANNDACPRYSGRVVRGVKIGPSPDWLKNRLETIGIKSINNVVDITNFVMHETGQPLHAFDLKKISGSEIRVDFAKSGEKFKTLDGTELELDGSELMIRDREHPLALAGVVGGLDSGIGAETSDILVESAYFSPRGIRRTARKFGIDTESSYRFSRGVNVEAIPAAQDRAVSLILQVAGGEAAKSSMDVYPKPMVSKTISISKGLIEERLGYAVEWSEAKQWFKRLGCAMSEEQAETASFTPPASRIDLYREIDLVEEFARLNGYDKIPETLPKTTGAPIKQDPAIAFAAASEKFFQKYCLQVVNYHFLKSSFHHEIVGDSHPQVSACGLRLDLPPVKIVNPLNEDLDIMRASLVPGLVQTAARNFHLGNGNADIFELGKVHFNKQIEGAAAYQEDSHIGLCSWGEMPNVWSLVAKADMSPALRIRAVIDAWLEHLGIGDFEWVQILESGKVPKFFHPAQASRLSIGEERVGMLGTLHPSLTQKHKIRCEVAVAELDLEKIALAVRPRKYHPIASFPFVERDLAFVMPRALGAGAVEREIRVAAGPLLQKLWVFDLFEGESLGAENRSVGYRLSFQDPKATLDDVRINKIRDEIVAKVTAKFSIQLRA